MIFDLVASSIFWITDFTPSKPGAGIYNKKVPGKLVLRTVGEYKKVFCLQPGEYVQVKKEDEPYNTINIDRTVGEIVLGPQ